MLGNRIGVIFHEDWQEFSPLLYSHYGAGVLPIQVQNFLREYRKEHDINNSSGHLYDPSHMIVGLLQYIDRNIHIRVENLSEMSINVIKDTHEYPNCFDGGCWIINVSTQNYGQTICGEGYVSVNENIVDDKLESEYTY